MACDVDGTGVPEILAGARVRSGPRSCRRSGARVSGKRAPTTFVAQDGEMTQRRRVARASWVGPRQRVARNRGARRRRRQGPSDRLDCSTAAHRFGSREVGHPMGRSRWMLLDEVVTARERRSRIPAATISCARGIGRPRLDAARRRPRRRSTSIRARAMVAADPDIRFISRLPERAVRARGIQGASRRGAAGREGRSPASDGKSRERR